MLDFDPLAHLRMANSALLGLAGRAAPRVAMLLVSDSSIDSCSRIFHGAYTMI
jgi:hypothetical protein